MKPIRKEGAWPAYSKEKGLAGLGHTAAMSTPQPAVTAGDSTPPMDWVEPQPRRRAFVSRAASEEWLIGFVCLAIDIVSWILIYGAISYVRRDQFLVGPFEFVLVDVIQLTFICQALFMIGVYARQNDTRTLTYMAEHILAIAAAAAVSSLLIYAAATFDSSMKPSRSAVLVSFVIFLPWSILYRRVIWKYLSSSAATRAFLVIGSGELAARFFE